MFILVTPDIAPRTGKYRGYDPFLDYCSINHMRESNLFADVSIEDS